MKTKLMIVTLGLLTAILIGCYTPLLLSFVFAFWSIVLFGSISFLTWSWYVGIRRTGGEARSWLLPTAKFTAFMVLLSLVVIASSLIATKRRKSVAIYYALRVDPAIEAWKRKNGRYPTRLEEVPNLPRAPRFLHYSHSSSGSDQSWSLSLSKDGFSILRYESETKIWIWD